MLDGAEFIESHTYMYYRSQINDDLTKSHIENTSSTYYQLIRLIPSYDVVEHS